jgi:hypothetical protein
VLPRLISLHRAIALQPRPRSHGRNKQRQAARESLNPGQPHAP